MKMVLRSILITLLIFQFSNIKGQDTSVPDYAKFVDPFIGTGSIDSLSLSGSNFPGAVVPFGFVQLSPDTDDNPEDPCSGYDYADDHIVGFSHTHLSGTGVADLFDFLFMPFTGDDKWEAFSTSNEVGYSSKYSHNKESASPGYYQVYLDDPEINVELTASEHVGMHRYTADTEQELSLMIDLDHSLDKARPYWVCRILDAQIRFIDEYTIEGYRSITGWASHRRVYFHAEFSKPIKSKKIKAGHRIYTSENIANHKNLKAIVSFEECKNEPLVIKVGLSSVSFEGARNNLKAEVDHLDFDRVKNEARESWNKELSLIEMEGNADQKEIFYTSLYHLFIHPSNIADVNGDYINANGELKNASDKKHYSTFSLWDTYRAAHPMYTIIQEDRTASFINSMMRQYTDYGYLPVWQLWGKETYCMIGNHAIPVITDAMLKGIQGFDYGLAYEAVLNSSKTSHQNSAFNTLNKYKYMPENIETQSVSISLETAFNDWCVAEAAKLSGDSLNHKLFVERSRYYENLFDPKIGFFRSKDSNGNWIEPFSPLKYGGNGGYPFTEGNAWQYLWYVPHDINNFVDLMGGKKAFTAKLDEFFTLNAKPEDVNGNASGFIGQYAHGNEPSHHIAYLYNYSSKPKMAQYYTHKITTELYTSDPSGYSGNEDCGQMSAWYLFSSMGFYPVNPSSGIYEFGSPTVDSAVIHLKNGKSFKVITHKKNENCIYIKKVVLNGKKYKNRYISHETILDGGTLEFYLSE